MQHNAHLRHAIGLYYRKWAFVNSYFVWMAAFTRFI